MSDLERSCLVGPWLVRDGPLNLTGSSGETGCISAYEANQYRGLKRTFSSSPARLSESRSWLILSLLMQKTRRTTSIRSRGEPESFTKEPFLSFSLPLCELPLDGLRSHGVSMDPSLARLTLLEAKDGVDGMGGGVAAFFLPMLLMNELFRETVLALGDSGSELGLARSP